jgi:purine-binding chemotaxis protein CheW
MAENTKNYEDENEKELAQDEYMTFYLGKMKYAIELPKIREILTYPSIITPLPNTTEWVKGLINLRGEVVPILDIRIKFQTGEAIYNEDTVVIAVITEDNRMLGLVVDKVDDVQKINTSHLSPATEMGSAIPPKYLKGLVRLEDNQMLVIMDVESVIHKEELANS